LKSKLTLNCYQQESCCNPTLKNVKYETESGDPSSIWRNIFTTDFTWLMIKKYSKFLEIIPITNEQTSRIPDHSSIPAKVLLGNSCSSKVPLRDINFKVMFYWKGCYRQCWPFWAFLKRPNYFEDKFVIKLLSIGIPLQPHS
jgi:hypothetical protein